MRRWVPIARARYRVATSMVRRLRRFLLGLCYAFVAVLVGYLVPALIRSAVDVVSAFLLSVVAAAVLELVLFLFFFYFLLFPISRTLQEEQSGEQEILLKAPVRPGDVLLGNFLGLVPFYALFIAGIAGILVAMLQPLGVDLLQTAILLLVTAATFLSGLWIGVVIAAVLKTRLSRTARGRDIGKALSFLLALPLVGVMYAVMGGALSGALADPNTNGLVKAIMAVFPSSWSADLVTAFALHPGDLGAIWVQTLLEVGGVLLFFAGSLWVGARVADRAYRLDTGTFSGLRAKPDGAFYRGVRALGGGKSFGAFLVAAFKDYGRRLQNLSKIAYIAGLLVLIDLFVAQDSTPFDAFVMLVVVLPFGAAFVTGEVTARGKEALFVIRKAPSGETRLVAARLLLGWTVMVPLAVLLSLLSMALVRGISLPAFLGYVGATALISAGQVVFALGLFLLVPAFTDKPAEIIGNAMALMVFTALLVVGSVVMLGDPWAPVFATGLTWALGAAVLMLGRRRIHRLE